MEPWTTAKNFDPTISGSVETHLDPKFDPGSGFVTFRPRSNLYEKPARISTQISALLYDEVDLGDVPLESPQQFFTTERVPWQIANDWIT